MSDRCDAMAYGCAVLLHAVLYGCYSSIIGQIQLNCNTGHRNSYADNQLARNVSFENCLHQGKLMGYW